MTVGILGYGTVGKAIAAYHRGRGDKVLTYDRAMDPPEALDALNETSPVVFVCVGTPSLKDLWGSPLDLEDIRERGSLVARRHRPMRV